MATELLEQLKHALLGLDRDATLEAAGAIAAGRGGVAVREGVDALRDALEIVGRRFQEGEWFLNELVYSGEIAKQAMDLMSPLLDAAQRAHRGTLVVGTVAGDLHDLGKNVFVHCARGAGFRVIDLGIDVPADRFVAATREHDPLAVGMSCLLTICAGAIEETIAALERGGLRDGTRLLVGGAALTPEFALRVGADAFAPDAVTGTDLVRAWSTG